jgi:hypothetical protein
VDAVLESWEKRMNATMNEERRRANETLIEVRRAMDDQRRRGDYYQEESTKCESNLSKLKGELEQHQDTIAELTAELERERAIPLYTRLWAWIHEACSTLGSKVGSTLHWLWEWVVYLVYGSVSVVGTVAQWTGGTVVYVVQSGWSWNRMVIEFQLWECWMIRCPPSVPEHEEPVACDCGFGE